jgi:hypothetical protein
MSIAMHVAATTVALAIRCIADRLRLVQLNSISPGSEVEAVLAGTNTRTS